MRATDRKIRTQIDFCNELSNRLAESVSKEKYLKTTVIKEDVKRLRRELNEVSKMCEWGYES